MATPDVINGTDLLLYVGGVPVAGSTTHSLTLGSETRDTTNKDTAKWRTVLGGRLTWAISGSGMFAFDAAYGYSELNALLVAGTVVTLKFSTEVTGDTYWTGDAIITKIDLEAADGQNTTYSYEFVGKGVLTPVLAGGTIPNLLTAVTFDANNLQLDFDIAMSDPYLFDSDFTVKIATVEATITSVSRDTDERFFITITETITTGQAVTLSTIAGNIKSFDGGVLAALTDHIVTNLV